MEIINKELHRVVPTAIIHRKDGPPGGEVNKYLILQRSFEKKAFPGKWTVPGGGLEVDDYINLPKTTSDHWYFAVENSLKREISEETGLEVQKPKYLLDLTFIRPDNVPVIVLSYYCGYKSGEVRLDKDNINYAWVTCKEAKNYDLVEGLLGEIEMADNELYGAKKI